MQKFDKQRILSTFSCSSEIDIHIKDQVGSTDDWGKAFALQHVIDKTNLFVAANQTSGHGRLGRAFVPASVLGIYMSILLPIKNRFLPGLVTTSVAVVTVNVLKEFFPRYSFGVKWINDILIENRKCGGILTELIPTKVSKHKAIDIGIGLNVGYARFDSDLEKKAGSIPVANTFNRDVLVAKIAQQVSKIGKNNTYSKYLPEYRQVCRTLKKRIEVQSGNKKYVGVALDVGEDGSLIVQLDNSRIKRIDSQEVTKVLCPNDEYEG